jgi:hypothetical protein
MQRSTVAETQRSDQRVLGVAAPKKGRFPEIDDAVRETQEWTVCEL